MARASLKGGQVIPANSLFQYLHTTVMQIFWKKKEQKIMQFKLKIVSHAYKCAQHWNFPILDCLTLKSYFQSS